MLPNKHPLNMEPILLGNVSSRLDTLELVLLVIYVYTIVFESINVLQVFDFFIFFSSNIFHKYKIFSH